MTIDRSRIRVGMEVVAVDDEHLGRVQDIRDADFLLHHPTVRRDFDVPLSAVQRVDHDRLVLTIRGDEVEMMGWESAPPEPRP